MHAQFLIILTIFLKGIVPIYIYLIEFESEAYLSYHMYANKGHFVLNPNHAIKGRAFNSNIIFLPSGAPFTQESLQFEKYFLIRGALQFKISHRSPCMVKIQPHTKYLNVIKNFSA